MLQTRLNWLLWEEAMGTVGRMKKLEPEAAPETIQILQTAASDLIGRPYEPETFFRAAMGNADQSQTRWLELFAELRRTWADEFTPEAESRLQAADVQASLGWIKELQQEIDNIQWDHPALLDV